MAQDSNPTIYERILSESMFDKIALNFDDKYHQFDLISDWFSGKSNLFNKGNIEFLIHVSKV